MWGFSDRKKFWRNSKIDYSDNLFTNVFKFTFINTIAVFFFKFNFLGHFARLSEQDTGH